jgi:hypothetical protein
VAELCKEQGLPATIVPARRRWRAFEWLARRCNSIGAFLASLLPAALIALVLHAVPLPPPEGWVALTREVFLVSLLFFAIVFVPVAGLLSLGASPPLKDLPRGDPALRRLVQGIARRVARLRERTAVLPAAQQMILDDLLREAAQTESLAASLAESAQPPAPVTPEAETLPQGASRDRLAGRLLEIAAALDDALAVAAEPLPDAQSASGALSRLRGKIEFARRALPEIANAGAESSPSPAASKAR